jgi:hypothetical protein
MKREPTRSPRLHEDDSFGINDNVGEGFREANIQGLLPPDFACSLEGLCIVARLREPGIVEQVPPSPREADVLRRHDQVESQLNSLQFDDPLPGSYEQCCTIAAITYKNMIFRQLPPGAPEQVPLAEQLKEALEESDMDMAWSQNLGMLLWILLSSCALKPGTPVRSWFREELRGFTSRLRVILHTQWDDVCEILSKFLWSRAYCQEAGRDLWQEMLDHL